MDLDDVVSSISNSWPRTVLSASNREMTLVASTPAKNPFFTERPAPRRGGDRASLRVVSCSSPSIGCLQSPHSTPVPPIGCGSGLLRSYGLAPPPLSNSNRVWERRVYLWFGVSWCLTLFPDLNEAAFCSSRHFEWIQW